MTKHSKKQIHIRILLLTGLIGVLFVGALFSQSLAELARQERARKAQEPKPAKVFTNDDIAKPPSALTPPAAGEQSKKDTAAAKKEEAKPAGESGKNQADLEKEYREKFAKLREQVDIETKKLDVMQRELNLSQTQYYSDPNTALREQTFRSEINQRTQDIEQQKAAVEKANQAVSDLEEELRKKNLPASWAR